MFEEEGTCDKETESETDREEIEREGEIGGAIESGFEKEMCADGLVEKGLDEGETVSEKGFEKDGEGENDASGKVAAVQAEVKPGDDPSKG